MSVQSEINRIRKNLENAYALLNLRGATIPDKQVSDNLTNTIDSIKTADVQYDSDSKILTITSNVYD